MMQSYSYPMFTALLFVALAKYTASDGMMYRTQRLSKNMKEELMMRTPEHIEANGYMMETHEITTQDGYIITLHRIPYGKKEIYAKSRKGKKRVALLLHGLASSSVGWVMTGPKSFAFLLADAGYDVWLWNARGTAYSKKHVNLTADDPKFWNFSFHEQGLYDLPATIDYALKTTDQPSLYVVGHSKGTTISYILMSLRPEYNKKIRLLVCYAPAVYNQHPKSPIMQAFLNNTTPGSTKAVLELMNMHSVPEITEMNGVVRSAVNRLCSEGSYTIDLLCLRIMFLINGFNRELLTENIAPRLFIHFPAGTSIKEIIHFFQTAKSGRFAMYDYGKLENMRLYGSKKSPIYPISKVEVPVAIYYGANDLLIGKVDVERTVRETKNVAGVFLVPHPKFTHADFLWSSTGDKLVYLPTIKLMKNY